MASKQGMKSHHYETHHRGTEAMPFDSVIGVTDDGVPVMSNGDELFFSKQDSKTPGMEPLCSFQRRCPCKVEYTKLGYKWQCVEFVRRYLAATKCVWLVSVPTAEDIWEIENPIVRIPAGEPAEIIRTPNKSVRQPPQRGDMVLWSRSTDLPFGHVGIITHTHSDKVCVAEQNQGFEKWPENMPYSRELPLRWTADGAVELVDEEHIIGWITVSEPLYDFSKGDVADVFRTLTGPGQILRKPVPPRVNVPWIQPDSGRCDFYLKRSLTTNGDVSDAGRAEEHDVPSAFYFVDYDMWSRIGRAANSLHSIAMEATRKVLEDPDSAHLLEHYFGVPPEIQPLLRHSWELTPPMGGRFDFGYDGQRIVILEYNCDSSGALLECCDTQEKMAQSYGVTQGQSTGSFLAAKCVKYFESLHENEKACPKHKLIHCMIDDDDEERYTAMCMMNFAEEAGFRTKLCLGLKDFSYRSGSPINAAPQAVPTDHPTIVDTDDEEVLLVWKTWSWDTVLHQYSAQKASGQVPETPSLSDVLLNNNIRVLEPLWKAVTGSKAILPYMYALAPDHENMLAASFVRTKEIISQYHISKPVNGRAGQNIIMYDPVTDQDELKDAPRMDDMEEPVSTQMVTSSFSFANGAQSIDRTNECSPGKFFDSVVIYQQRLFLKKFDQKYFPIFCGWMIGDEFSGVVVREDTSKITKLASVVIPARVVRNNEPLGDIPRETAEEET